MVLTDDDKSHVKAIWARVQPHAEEIIADSLNRMYVAYCTTKTYFPHFDLSPNSSDIKAHAKKVASALTQAVNNLDNIGGALSKLSDLHAQELRVDPINFPYLSHCILVSIAANLSESLKPSTLLSLDKFMCDVCKCLTCKYR